MIYKIVITVAKRQLQTDILSDQNITEKNKQIEILLLPSDASLTHSTRVYIYFLAAFICIIFGQPLGVFHWLFLRKIIESVLKPFKIQRLLQNTDIEEESV